MTTPKTFAFVFARGGSKGLPGKNLLPIAGHPMLAHGINIACQLGEISQVFISTDCPKIADVANSYGAEIIMRPDHLASDTAPEWLAWQHAISHVQSGHGNFDRFLSLPPTAPCRSIADVERCLNALTSDVDIAITTTASQRSPWFNMAIKSSKEFLQLVNDGSSIKRRQDAPQCFDIATVAYASRPDFIMNARSIWDGRVRGVEVPYERAIDIDTPVDYAIARFIKEQYIPTLSKQDNA